MIEGTPPREVVTINVLGAPQRSYADAGNDVALSAPVHVDLHPEATQLRGLRTRLTGHGHDSNTGNYPHCCEWKNNTHYPDGERHAWWTNGISGRPMNVRLNPVYPQGGTWLAPRRLVPWRPGEGPYGGYSPPHVAGSDSHPGL